jgi:hypothetical protein
MKGRLAMKSTILLLSAVLLSGAFLLAAAADELTPTPAGKAGCPQCKSTDARP